MSIFSLNTHSIRLLTAKGNGVFKNADFNYNLIEFIDLDEILVEIMLIENCKEN